MSNENIYMIIVGVLLIVTVVLNRFQAITIKKYQLLTKESDGLTAQLLKVLKDNDKYSSSLFKYCLAHIMKSAIEKEDFETAKECKQALDELIANTNKK